MINTIIQMTTAIAVIIIIMHILLKIRSNDKNKKYTIIVDTIMVYCLAIFKETASDIQTTSNTANTLFCFLSILTFTILCVSSMLDKIDFLKKKIKKRKKKSVKTLDL